MTIFQFTVLFLVFIVLVLIAAHIFHRYERAIFWSVALFLFIGVLVLLGTGVLKIIKDGHANSGALFVAFMCLITAGVLVIATQEPESFIRKRRKAISNSVQEVYLVHVMIPMVLLALLPLKMET